MWPICFVLSVGCIVLPVALALMISGKTAKGQRTNPVNLLFAGVFLAAFFLFFPIHKSTTGLGQAMLLSVFNSIQVFASGCEFQVITGSMEACPDWMEAFFQLWASALFVCGPVLTFGFVLSLFKSVSAYLNYFRLFFRDVCVFSRLNDQSLTLAADMRKNDPKRAIVFTDGFDDIDPEHLDRARELGAVFFRKDLLAVNFDVHSGQKELSFFCIDDNETRNLNNGLTLIERYRNREKTNLYVFSTGMEGELLLNTADKGKVRVRRINQVQSLISRTLYERGDVLFSTARPVSDDVKKISAVIVGMGRHGTEMLKALAWYCQMDGYQVEIHAFDKDKLAKSRFTALAPELMSSDYNGVEIPGEAQYRITVHPGLDVETDTFARKIAAITDATYVLVALGDDEMNIKTAVMMRMYFERIGLHPVIQAIVHNSQQKKALEGIRNYRGQAYDLEFIGDLESSYAESVILDTELEEQAKKRHLKWGEEEEFWGYEYNYRSSMAAAIHRQARIACGIPGADKKEEDLTPEEKAIIEPLEHRRWNAYMRSEGYVYSKSKDPASRNDLAKMHHDLVDFSELTEETKRKDSRVGTD